MTETDDDLSKERFGFTVFLSACFHAILILGVGFTYLEQTDSATAIEITLAQYQSDVAPDDADFLAQENQTGSGTLDTVAAPSTPFESEFNDDEIQEVFPVQQTPESASEIEVPDDAVVSSTNDDAQTQPLTEQNVPEPDSPRADQSSQDAISLSIASLRAQLDLQRQAYAKRPRKYTISSASTKKSQDALYLDNWRKRIEAIGNLNYPDAARQQQLYGSLRLLVSILPDGSVERIRILQSSGQSILDQSALEIVQLAAPFQPFPDELKKTVDVLEIIRTWRFHERTGLTSY